MHPDQFQELLSRFSKGRCTPEEEKFVVDWYNAIGRFEDTALDDAQRQAIQQRIWSAINPERFEKSNTSYLKWAAVIVVPLLALAGYIGIRSMDRSVSPRSVADASAGSPIRYYNDGSEARTINLTDGSVVVLKPLSELIVNNDFKDKTREVRLKGEAFFKVQRDPQKPFIVYANEVVTKVLGTSFNIKAYENESDITVAVTTGKVAVYANKQKTSGNGVDFQTPEVILTPNQEMVYHRGGDVLAKKLVDKPEIILPDSHLFRMKFENTPVPEIFEMLKKNYGVEIQYDKMLMTNCKLTTSMSDEGLYERIEVICKAIGASYTVHDAVIVIKSNGC